MCLLIMSVALSHHRIWLKFFDNHFSVCRRCRCRCRRRRRRQEIEFVALVIEHVPSFLHEGCY